MTKNAETYDGTCWAAITDINTARTYGCTGGDSSSGFIGGGGTPANTTATEELTGAGAVTNKTLTTS
jgi:hypothetical protein